MPGRLLGERWRAVQEVARELASDEAALGLPLTRAPDAGFVALAQGWASGKELGPLLSPPDAPTAPAGARNLISAGDFVRNVKQLIDLLRQMGEVLADETSARWAGQAANALFRGVVAASSVVSARDEVLTEH